MTQVVIDSHNLAQVLADAGAPDDVLEPRVDMTKPEAKPEAKAEAKEGEAKVEAKVEDDDVEGEDGLTARQKREMSTSMLKAIGKKHRMAKEAEEFADATYKEKMAAERRLQAAERELAELKAKVEPPSNDRPERTKFETDDAYTEALIDWKADQKVAQWAAEQRETNTRAQLQKQIERAMEMVPDFKEVTSEASMDVPRPIAEAMRESDLFAELGYHFAKHPAVLDKLGRLSVNKQLVELGKIEATLTPFGSKEPKASAQRADDDDTSSLLDTGFSPSKARRDAPVIKPLNSSEGLQNEPDVREKDVRQHIQQYQKDKKVNLSLRRRH